MLLDFTDIAHFTIVVGNLLAFSLISCPVLPAFSDGDCSGDGLYGMRNYSALMLAELYLSITASGPLVLYLGHCWDLRN